MKPPMRGPLVLLILASTAANIFSLSGCSQSRKSHSPEDRSDPKKVAMAFLMAVRSEDVEKAASYVVLDEREAFMKEFRPNMLPNIPEVPDLLVTVKELSGAKRADVDVRNAKGLGLDMVFADGQWWITK